MIVQSKEADMVKKLKVPKRIAGLKVSSTGQAIRRPLQLLQRASRAARHKGARTKGAVTDGSERLGAALREGVAAFKASLEHGPIEPRAGELNTESVAAFKASLDPGRRIDHR